MVHNPLLEDTPLDLRSVGERWGWFNVYFSSPLSHSLTHSLLRTKQKEKKGEGTESYLEICQFYFVLIPLFFYLFSYSSSSFFLHILNPLFVQNKFPITLGKQKHTTHI